MQTTSNLSSVPASSSVTTQSVPAKVARVRCVHDLATLFPEVPAISAHRGRKQPGFVDSAAGGVYSRIPGFLQEEDFLLEFTSFVMNPKRFVFTLFGPTGCGKSERVLDFYSRMNIPVHRYVATRDSKPHHFISDVRIGEKGMELVPKALYKAMKNGHPFLIDEVYRLSPGITSKFHEIRDRGHLTIDDTGETIKAAPGFKFIGTANQGGLGDDTGMYVGDEVQDMAWLNGSLSFVCNYPNENIEIPIVQRTLEEGYPAFRSDSHLATYARKMVAVAAACRAAMAGDSGPTTGRFELPFSTRNLVMWAESFVDYHCSHPNRSGSVHPLYKALDAVMTRRACEATRNAIDSFVLAQFGFDRTVL
jgi:cobaltochelatase CobS